MCQRDNLYYEINKIDDPKPTHKLAHISRPENNRVLTNILSKLSLIVDANRDFTFYKKF